MVSPILSSAPNLETTSIIPLHTSSESTKIGSWWNVDEPPFNSLPSSYSFAEDGIYFWEQDGDDVILTRLCSPLIVHGKCRRSDKSDWGRVVSVRDSDGIWHKLILDARNVEKRSATALNALFDCGFELGQLDKVEKHVGNLLATWQTNEQLTRARCAGWVDESFEAFILGNGKVLGNARAILDSVSRDVARAVDSKGTLKEWRSTVAKPAIDNPLMVLAISHAFSGPLLSFLGYDGGGFHLRGVSSRGKTTLLRAAASVWGAPNFVQSWRGTTNGIEGIASACNDHFLALDELNQIAPREIGDAVYMLSNGHSKIRMKSNGKAQDTSRWSIPVLSSGEISLEEHMASGGQKMKEGQDVRFIELAADSRRYGAFDVLHGHDDGGTFSRILQQAVNENYGHAGPAFVKGLMQHRDKRGNLLRAIERFAKKCEARLDVPLGGQEQRVLRRFGIAMLAGEAATNFGLTGWQKGTAIAASQESFMEWFETRDGSTHAELTEAVEKTRDYIANHQDRFISVDHDDEKGSDGWKDDNWFYIRPECWRRIHGSDNMKEAAQLHSRAGYLKSDKGKGLQFRMSHKIKGRPRVYAVNSSILTSNGSD